MVDKDYTRRDIYKTLGASNHSEEERPLDDYYATEPRATNLLLEVESFDRWVLEPACGAGHMSIPIEQAGHIVFSFDKIDRGYGVVKDFFDYKYWRGDIITNPPYKYAQEFVEHSLDIIDEGHKVAMFLKLTFLEGQQRRRMFDMYPPKIVYVASARLKCAKNGDFSAVKGSAVSYAWFIWQKGWEGNTVVKWIN